MKLPLFTYNQFRILMVVILLAVLAVGCSRDTVEIKSGATGTLTDIDGNIYHTVKIGNQWWMADNLRVKTYRNGKPIHNAQAAADWGDSTGSYCQYDMQVTAPGLLYNGYALRDSQGIAPAGWHIPTDEEWKALEVYLGMTGSESNKSGWRGTHEADKLRMKSPGGWSVFGEIWSTDESGFNAEGGSCRLFNAQWGFPGLKQTGFWWTATTAGFNDCYYRYMDYKSSMIYRSHDVMNYGFSIRCVKDAAN